MPQPQGGLLPDGNSHALFLTLRLTDSTDNADKIRRALAAVPALTAELAEAEPAARLRSVVAIGSRAWDALWPGARPARLRAFTALRDGTRSAPATAADILLHLRGERHDLNFELARRLLAAFGPAVDVVEEVHGFRYLDSRDLTGFVDGTENPTGAHRAEVALVGAEDDAFAGGSYVAVQRYIHDLAAWQALPVPAQEAIIARTKQDDVEFAAADKPPTAHIKRVSIKQDGASVEILRHSMPYGTTGEAGLYFIAYAASPDNFDSMLAAMVVADEDGHYDHLLDYSHAVTGASFFAPSLDFLAGGAGGRAI